MYIDRNESRVLRRGRKWHEVGDDYIMRNFATCMLHQILLG
jgi:Ni/Co efflux regulator RcnB